MSVVSVYAVFADAEEAERIGRTVVEEQLAACVNILGPIRSIYRWEGKIETADEVAAIFKTHHWHADALIDRPGRRIDRFEPRLERLQPSLPGCDRRSRVVGRTVGERRTLEGDELFEELHQLLI